MADNFLIACFYVCEMRLLYRQVFKLFNDCDRPTDNPKTMPSTSDRICLASESCIRVWCLFLDNKNQSREDLASAI